MYKKFFKDILWALADFFFPPYCRVCGTDCGDERIICSECRSNLLEKAMSYTPPLKNIPDVDGIIVLLPYDEKTRNLIHDLKYRGIHSLGPILGNLMAQKTLSLYKTGPEQVIIPVPLHPGKLKSRGYNQSERLAAGFAAVTGWKVDETLISRSRNTGTQTALTHENRKENVSGAFVFSGKENLKGKSVILMDDVLTTGSTVSECAKALREGGTGKISVVVAASPDVGKE